jgi:ankyrin repeat protein
MDALIAHNQNAIYQRRKSGETYLHFAAAFGSAAIVNRLIDLGLDKNEIAVNSTWAPLHYAANLDNVDTIEALVIRGANQNVKAVFNKTPFDIAVEEASIRAVQLLLFLQPNLDCRFSISYLEPSAPGEDDDLYLLGYLQHWPAIYNQFRAQAPLQYHCAQDERRTISTHFGATQRAQLNRELPDELVNYLNMPGSKEVLKKLDDIYQQILDEENQAALQRQSEALHVSEQLAAEKQRL